ncbi:hypothetical protein [Celeribacter sp. ULVN23_4]
MRKSIIVLALVSSSVLAGCMETDGQRALTGAAAGAVVAEATNNNVLTGAALGALAGTYCDDAGVCN